MVNFRIKEARELAGYSQKEIAQIIGVAQNTFHGYESGKHDPKSDILVKIANVCNVTVDFLLGREDSNPTNSYSQSESEHIKKYHTLDEYGKQAVDGILETEYQRCKKQKNETIPLSEDVEADEFAEQAKKYFLKEKRQESLTSSVKESDVG